MLDKLLNSVANKWGGKASAPGFTAGGASETYLQPAQHAARSAPGIGPDQLALLAPVQEIAVQTALINQFALSPNQSILALQSKTRLKLCQVADGQVVCELERIKFDYFTFSPRGTLMVTWCRYAEAVSMRVWRVQDGTLVCEVKHVPYGVNQVIFSPNENFLLVETRAQIQLYHITTGQLLRDWTGNRVCLGFVPESNELVALLVVGSYTVELWKITAGFALWQVVPVPKLKELSGRTRGIEAMYGFPLTAYAVAKYREGEWVLYSLQRNVLGQDKWQLVVHCRLGSFTAVAFPVGASRTKLAIIANENAQMMRKDKLETLPSQAQTPVSVKYSADNRVVAVQFSDQRIRLYDPSTLTLLRTLVVDGNLLGFTPDMLITGCPSHTNPRGDRGYLAKWTIWKIVK